ncbi:MAG: CPBP family intramembrane glutamic endopeptidase [Aeromicrobium sp.]
MRVQPRPLISVGLTIGYMAIVAITWAVVGLDYDEVGDTTSNIIKGIVVPVALGAVFLAAATSYLGWWGPAIHEKLRAPKWLWAVPVLMAVPGLGSLLGGFGPADRSAGYLLALGVGTLLVGFSEEMLTRGTGLVGLRGGFGEAAAWFFSCLIFGLIHALNVVFGQAIGTTVQQIGFAFVAGSVLYITRRVAGTLIVAMLLHAWIDFTTLGFQDAAADAESSFVVLNFLQWGAFVLAIAGVVIVLRHASHRDEASRDARTPA